MARYIGEDIVDQCKKNTRKVNVKIEIDWFGTGEFETIERADDEFISLTLDRSLEGNLGVSIRDIGTLTLDNSNNDYSPKSLASRFNILEEEIAEYNVIPNRWMVASISIDNSEYYPIFSGVIKRIRPNYDNSEVSISIDDIMSILKTIDCPDKLYINEKPKDIIKDFLSQTPLSYEEDSIDEIPGRITHNFSDFDNMYNAIQKISEKAWGFFFTNLGTFYLKNTQKLGAEYQGIIETLEEENWFSVEEDYDSENLYNEVEIKSHPLLKQSEQVIWTGGGASDVSEVYLGEEIDGDNKLQLAHTPGESEDIESTQNLPIVGFLQGSSSSVSVSFGDKFYTIENGGLASIDHTNGIIEFANTEEHPLPLPVEELEVSYQHHINYILPNSSKTLFANLNDPAINIESIIDTLSAQSIEGETRVTNDPQGSPIDDIVLDSGGSPREESIFINVEDEEATRFKIQFDYTTSSFTYWLIGRTSRARELQVDLYINGEFNQQLTSGRRGHYESDRIIVLTGDEVEVKFKFEFNGDNSNSECIIENISYKIYESWLTGIGDRIDKLDVTQDVYSNNTRVKLEFTNDSDDIVELASEYNGEVQDSIILIGVPFQRSNRIKVVESDPDAGNAFNNIDSKLSIQNDFFRSEERVKQSVDFLLWNLSTPKTELSIRQKGLIHLDLLDKVLVEQDNRDIDNEFLIWGINDYFDSDGNWEQVYNLKQAMPSNWQYNEEGIVSIIDNNPKPPSDLHDRPPHVKDVEANFVPRLTDDNKGFPAIEVKYNMSNRYISSVYIYYKSKNKDDWIFFKNTEDNECVINEITSSGEYEVKVQSENYQGLKSNFDESPVDNAIYNIEDLQIDNFQITEGNKVLGDGTYIPTILVSWDIPDSHFYDSVKIYLSEDLNNWNQVGLSKDDNFEILLSEIKKYYVKLVAQDKFDNEVDFNNAIINQIDIKGKQEKPNSIDFKSIKWLADKIVVEYELPNEKDYEVVEIRLDDNFGAEEKI